MSISAPASIPSTVAAPVASGVVLLAPNNYTIMAPTRRQIVQSGDRKHRPVIIINGLSETVYNLSSVHSTTPVSNQSTENKTSTPLATSDLSHLLSLPSPNPNTRRQRRRRRGQREGSHTGPTFENEEAPTSEDEGSRELRGRRPTLKRQMQKQRTDEASHLCRDEREEYEKKRDERLAHYKLIDTFKLHTEDVLWI